MRTTRYSGKRPRYPQKRRNTSRRFLPLVVLPLLLVLLIAGSIAIFSGSDEEVQMSGPAALHIHELAPAEAYPTGPLADGLRFDLLLLEKSERRLTAFSKGKAVRVYLVALGESPLGRKEYQGDKRTPEGRYTIDDKNPRSAYHKNLGISYPNEDDRKRALDRGRDPGGDIKIHGLAPMFADIGPAHRATDWTYGCVAVTNEEIDELFARTPVGTPIEIVP